ncbi:MAG: orotidine-5'-phosphate decarboxylase [Pseudomonadota bacterium]
MFADRLIEAVRSKGTPLCVGLDPLPDRIPEFFGQGVAAVRTFCESIVDIAADHAAIVKPQLGFFEPFGAEGFAVAQALCARAQTKGLLVLLDAKRGDIGTTAEGYAKASFGIAGFNADCVTVNPYLGRDSLEPFLKLAEQQKRGVAVLVRTSNPGARDLQDLDVNGAPLWRRVGEMIAPEAARLKGASGWSGLMAVAGATYPDEARTLRQTLPTSLFLVPGYGAQGASATDAVAGFIRGPHGREGGIVSSSRAVLYPAAAQEAQSLPAWRASIAEAMASAATELALACTE